MFNRMIGDVLMIRGGGALAPWYLSFHTRTRMEGICDRPSKAKAISSTHFCFELLPHSASTNRKGVHYEKGFVGHPGPHRGGPAGGARLGAGRVHRYPGAPDYNYHNRPTDRVPARPKVIQRTCSPKLRAHVWLRQVGVTEGHCQALMPEHLAHQLQVPDLPENGRGRIVAQGVRPHLAR